MDEHACTVRRRRSGARPAINGAECFFDRRTKSQVESFGHRIDEHASFIFRREWRPMRSFLGECAHTQSESGKVTVVADRQASWLFFSA